MITPFGSPSDLGYVHAADWTVRHPRQLYSVFTSSQRASINEVTYPVKPHRASTYGKGKVARAAIIAQYNVRFREYSDQFRQCERASQGSSPCITGNPFSSFHICGISNDEHLPICGHSPTSDLGKALHGPASAGIGSSRVDRQQALSCSVLSSNLALSSARDDTGFQVTNLRTRQSYDLQSTQHFMLIVDVRQVALQRNRIRGARPHRVTGAEFQTLMQGGTLTPSDASPAREKPAPAGEPKAQPVPNVPAPAREEAGAPAAQAEAAGHAPDTGAARQPEAGESAQPGTPQ